MAEAPSQGSENPTHHASERLARAITAGLRSSQDLRSVRAWARTIGASTPTLRCWCRTAHERPKRVLDCMRLLRAVMAMEDGPADLFEILDIIEPRTLMRMLQRGGVRELFSTRSPTIAEFLSSQQFLSNPGVVRALMGILSVSTSVAIDSARSEVLSSAGTVRGKSQPTTSIPTKFPSQSS